MQIKILISAIIILFFISISSCKPTIPNQSTISVSGIGTVMVKPDMVQINISLSNISKTTRQAQETVTKSVKQALEILKEAQIDAKNITTTSLRFSTEYDYYQGRQTVVGQRAEQRIMFSVENIATDQAQKVSDIIDKLTLINGIGLDQMNFNVKNRTEHYVKSRELAYQKALDKAKQYASLSGLKIVKVLNISEDGGNYISPRAQTNNIMYKESRDESVAGETILPTGELEITTNLSVVFLME